jgi:phosphoglycolate phosphatase-like HAD superfamily hydrolase
VFGVREVLGVETRNDNIPLHGMLDPDILLTMMRNAGVSRDTAVRALPAVFQAAERYYASHPADLRDKTCPGVRFLLRRLQHQAALIGLVSGNLCRIGWKKLERADLDQFFQFGAFGEMAPTRIELTRLAVRHAGTRGWTNGVSRGYLIGDTPNDVEAGRANGLDTIAVATGLSSLEELQAASATVVARDLTAPSIRRLLRVRP